jgi:hypothetical protein
MPRALNQREKFEAVSQEGWPEYAARIPGPVLDGLVNYLYHGDEPGHFLAAVLTNDLMLAVSRADKDSMAALREITQFVYNRIPGDSWGSTRKIDAWREKRMAALAEMEKAEASLQEA